MHYSHYIQFSGSLIRSLNKRVDIIYCNNSSILYFAVLGIQEVLSQGMLHFSPTINHMSHISFFCFTTGLLKKEKKKKMHANTECIQSSNHDPFTAQ